MDHELHRRGRPDVGGGRSREETDSGQCEATARGPGHGQGQRRSEFFWRQRQLRRARDGQSIHAASVQVRPRGTQGQGELGHVVASSRKLMPRRASRLADGTDGAGGDGGFPEEKAEVKESSRKSRVGRIAFVFH